MLIFSHIFLGLNFLLGQNTSLETSFTPIETLIKELKFVDAESQLNQLRQNSSMKYNKRFQLKSYDLMAEIYFQTGKLQQMKQEDTQLISLAQELKDTLHQIQGYNRMGIFYMNEGEAKKAESYFHKALSLGLEKKANIKTAEIYSNLASNFLNVGKKELAADWFFKSLKLREKLKDEKGVGETFSNLASVFYLMGNIEDAIHYQQESIQIREKIKDTSGLVITHMNIGQLYILKNEMKEARTHLQKSVNYAESTQNPRLMASSYAGMAAYFNRVKDYAEALIWYKKAIQIFETDNNKQLLSRLYVAAGNVAKELKEVTTAQAYYQKALDYSLQLNNKENISNAYEKLSTFHQEQNQLDKALHYYKNYVLYKDSINATSNLAKIEEIRTQYETEKKDNEILKLQSQQRIRDLQIEKQNAIIAGNKAEAQRIQNEMDLLAQTQALNDLKLKQQQEDLEKQILITKNNKQALLLAQQKEEINASKLLEQRQFRNFLLIGFILSLLMGGILFNRFKLKKKLEQQEALLAVRNHIARDLHDKVGSTLTGIKILSEVSAKSIQHDKKTLNFIQQITEQTKSIQQEMSDIVWAINPNNDKIENLVVRMREYVAQTLEPKNIEIQMDVDKDVLDQNLNMSSRKEFFLIFREAINNIAKHAQATKVNISVIKSQDNLQMIIQDDGIGMDTTQTTSSNGIKNMKERANTLQGQIQILSQIGMGTKIHLNFPTT